MSDDRKDLPPVTAPNFLEKVRETVSTYLGNRGNLLDRGLTLRDMSDAKLIALSKGFLATGRGSPVNGPGAAIEPIYTPDLTPPPTPSGFSATTSKTSIQVVTDPQTYQQGHGHAKTRVYGASYTGTPMTFSDAVMLTEFSGDVFAFPVDPASEYRLWVTWVTQDGQESAPAGGANGVTAEAGLLDSANIAFLTASKIRAGSISVGEYIQSSGYVAGVSGWRINGDGTAEFSGVVVRGGVYATYGLIGGITIAASAVRAGQTDYNTGIGFHLGSDGRMSLGNSVGNRLTWDSTALEIVGSITATTGAIGGNAINATGIQSPGYTAGSTGWRLDTSGLIKAYADSGARVIDMAATGSSPVLKIGAALEILASGSATFGGTLTASAVNAVDTINLAGNSVTASNSANGENPSTNINVPSGQTMRITSIAYSPSYSTGGSITYERSITHELNGVTSTESAGWYSSGVSTYRSDYIASICYAEVAGPATVTASFTGGSGTITIFGSMR